MKTIGGFKVKRSVTVQLFKLVPGNDNFFHVQGAMFVGEKLEENKEAATLMHVVDMTTGEEGQIICPTILQKELIKQYPDNSYVGKRFWLRITRVPTKKYNMVEIAELEDDDVEADENTATVSSIDEKSKSAGKRKF